MCLELTGYEMDHCTSYLNHPSTTYLGLLGVLLWESTYMRMNSPRSYAKRSPNFANCPICGIVSCAHRHHPWPTFSGRQWSDACTCTRWYRRCLNSRPNMRWMLFLVSRSRFRTERHYPFSRFPVHEEAILSPSLLGSVGVPLQAGGVDDLWPTLPLKVRVGLTFATCHSIALDPYYWIVLESMLKASFARYYVINIRRTLKRCIINWDGHVR